MNEVSMSASDPTPSTPRELTIAQDECAYIIVKASAFGAEVESSGLEDGSNATDDREVGILEPAANPTRAELVAAITDLPEEGLFELVALVLIGRGDFDAAEFVEALGAARDIADRNLVTYLVETPLLGDLLDQGLEEVGYSPLGDGTDA